MNLDVGFVTDRGRTRSSNQDFLSVSLDAPAARLASHGRLLVIADGFGKDNAGQLASMAAVQAVVRAYYGGDQANVLTALTSAVQQANTAVYHATSGAPPDQAGTTMTAVVLHQGVLFVAHVGDSRAYLWRDGRLVQLTQDHAWAAEQVRTGKLTPEQAAQHPKRRNLTRALGIQATVEIDQASQTFAPGDVLLLCTDGLVDQVSEQEILDALQPGSAQAAAQRLVDLANQHGGGDNVSVIVARSAPPAATAGAWLPWAIIGAAVSLVLLVVLLASSPPRPGAWSTATVELPAPGMVIASVIATPTIPVSTTAPTAAATPDALTQPPAATARTPVAPARKPVVPAIAYSAPEPSGPDDGAVFRGRQEEIKLQWRSVGALGPDDYYVVITEFPHEGQLWRDEQQTKNAEILLPTYLFDLVTGNRELSWRVVVWRAPQRDATGHLVGVPVSLESPVRRLTWRLADADSTPAPATPPATVEPTAEPTQEPTETPRYEG